MIYEEYEAGHLDRIEKKIAKISEMTREERQFLNGLVRYHKPRKILELGVSAGASSAVLLNAVDNGATVHSIDYLPHWYRDPNKKSGFLVSERLPELEVNWHIYRGGTAACFMDEIGGDIDLCLLDTMHSNPGEILDFLMVLPYLGKNAIVVLHDIALHTLGDKFCDGEDISSYDNVTTCATLYASLRGERLPATRTINNRFANIGAVRLSDTIAQDPWPFFHLLTLPWENWDYLSQEEWQIVRQFISRHYSDECLEFFQKILDYKKMRRNIAVKNVTKPSAREDLSLFGSAYSRSGRTSFYDSRRIDSMPIGKKAFNFAKSYFLFPWYVYKIYHAMKS